MRKQAVISSRIEGIQATLIDLLTFEAEHEPSPEADVEEVCNYLAALITLDPQRAPLEAEAAGSPFRTPRELAGCAVFRRHLEQQVETVNASLARYETIKKFVILPAELSIETGELTPTMKLKRRVVTQKYAAEIDSLYA